MSILSVSLETITASYFFLGFVDGLILKEYSMLAKEIMSTKVDTAGFIRIRHKRSRPLEPCKCRCDGGVCCAKNYCPCRKAGFYCGEACSCICNKQECDNSLNYQQTENSLSVEDILFIDKLIEEVDVSDLLDLKTDDLTNLV